MPTGPLPPRHRAVGIARTPLHVAAAGVTQSLDRIGRRGVVAVGASGLLVSMLGAPASAAVRTDHPSVDTYALTALARTALAVSPRVSVPAEAVWTFDAPVISIEADPPPPPPAPEPVSRRTAQAAAAPAAAIGAAAPASANGSAIVEIAARYVGVSYLYGGTSPDGFDCSGFTSYVYAQVGITLPRTSGDQRYAGTEVAAADAQPGDLIWSPGHVSIYAGGNLQIDSPVPGKTIQIREIWQSNPVFIRVG